MGTGRRGKVAAEGKEAVKKAGPEEKKILPVVLPKLRDRNFQPTPGMLRRASGTLKHQPRRNPRRRHAAINAPTAATAGHPNANTAPTPAAAPASIVNTNTQAAPTTTAAGATGPAAPPSTHAAPTTPAGQLSEVEQRYIKDSKALRSFYRRSSRLQQRQKKQTIDERTLVAGDSGREETLSSSSSSSTSSPR